MADLDDASRQNSMRVAYSVLSQRGYMRSEPILAEVAAQIIQNIDGLNTKKRGRDELIVQTLLVQALDQAIRSLVKDSIICTALYQ